MELNEILADFYQIAITEGYNDGQNDYRAGQPFNDISHSIQPFDDYKAGYSQGYIDARNLSYNLC